MVPGLNTVMQDDYGKTHSPLLGKIEQFRRELKDPKKRKFLRNEKLKSDLMNDLMNDVKPKRKLIDYTARKESHGADFTARLAGSSKVAARPKALGGALVGARLPSVRSIERSFESNSSLEQSDEKIEFYLKVPPKRLSKRSSSTASNSIEDLRATLRAGRSSATKQKSPLFGSLQETSIRRKLSLQSVQSTDDLETIRRCDSVNSSRSAKSATRSSRKRRNSTTELGRLSPADKLNIDNILARTMNLELSSTESLDLLSVIAAD